MKLLSILVLILTLNFSTQANTNDYNFLTIVIDENDDAIEKVIYYPKGSTYRVYLTKKEKETIKNEDFVIYEGDMQLTIYPEYRKNRPDHVDIKGKRLRIFLTAQAAFDAGFGADWNHDSATKNTNSNDHEISVEKKLKKSKTNIGKYNVTLTFSNGIIFKYDDGKFNAKLDGEYIDIKGNYIIKTKKGILKFSFNPENGEVWWIFDEK